MVLDASNRFYTLIPHDFGMQKPTMLDTLDIITVGLHQNCIEDRRITTVIVIVV